MTNLPRRDGAPRPAGTLYTRASLFVIVGSGALLGALVAMSILIVEDSRERLLNERFALAHAVGALLESQIRADVERLLDASQVILEDPTVSRDSAAAELLLQTAVRSGSLREGAFVLDYTRRPLVGAPDPADRVRDIEGIERLLDAVQHSKALELSVLGHTGGRPLMAAVAPVLGRRNAHVGYAVGLLQPAASDLLAVLRHTSPGRQADLALLDANGVQIATTDPHRMLERAPRSGPLARAVAACKERRRRESCQGEATIGHVRKVLVVAPLPELGLSVIIVQSEEEALAPAYQLRFRLLALGGAVVVLFVGFNLLSIQSIVSPVRRLTERVRRADAQAKPLAAAGFGNDEIAELAESMRTWQQANLRSLARAEEGQRALHAETEAIRRHLDSLQEISDASTSHDELTPMLELSLQRALHLVGSPRGMLELAWGGQKRRAAQGLDAVEADALLAAARADATPPGALAYLVAPSEAMRLELVALEAASEDPGARLWVERLLRHVGMCTSQFHLRESDRLRRRQQEEYLHRTLQAQEDERSRVARDLHDTVAQDLAALRLDAERLAGRATDPALREQLATFEVRAQEMLATIRRILLDLRISILDGHGFVPAVQSLLDRARDQGALHTHLEVEGEQALELSYPTAIALFRVVQEALLNVVQHAGASHLFVTLEVGDPELSLTIEDDGAGFDTTALSSTGPTHRETGRGLGILGMQERVHLVGGTLEIESHPGEGTTLRVRVPRRKSDIFGTIQRLEADR